MIQQGNFLINGLDGIGAFSSHLTTYPNIPKPKRKGVVQSLPNASRDVFSQSKSYENREFELEIATVPKDHDDFLLYDSTLFKTFSSDDYQKFVFYGEPEMTYFVKMVDVVETQRIARLSEARISKFKLTAGAFKYVDYENIIDVQKGSTLYNPTPYEALPYIKIVGSGDITLIINGREHKFSNVADYIESDSDELQQDIFKGDALMNDHYLSDELPFLDQHENDIDWTGNVKQLLIQPRWRTI